MLPFMQSSHTRHEATIHAAISYEGCIDKELYRARYSLSLSIVYQRLSLSIIASRSRLSIRGYIARDIALDCLSIESERSRVRVKTQKIERKRRRDRWPIKKINGCWRTAPSRHDTPVPSVRVFFRIPAGDSGNPLLSASCVGCSYTHTHTHTHCVCVCVCVSRLIASIACIYIYTYISI